MDEKKQNTQAEAGELENNQLADVDGGVSSDTLCYEVVKYRCPKDGGELTHHSKREYHFPLILRRIYWWTCNICGAQYSPKDKSLTKVG